MKKKNRLGLKIFIWVVIIALFGSIIGPVVYSLFPAGKQIVINNTNTSKKIKETKEENKEEIKKEIKEETKK